jgi:hypothetical protein
LSAAGSISSKHPDTIFKQPIFTAKTPSSPRKNEIFSSEFAVRRKINCPKFLIKEPGPAVLGELGVLAVKNIWF